MRSSRLLLSVCFCLLVPLSSSQAAGRLNVSPPHMEKTSDDGGSGSEIKDLRKRALLENSLYAMNRLGHIYMNGEGPADIARADAIWREGLAKYPNSALLKTKMAWGHWTAAWRYWATPSRRARVTERTPRCRLNAATTQAIAPRTQPIVGVPPSSVPVDWL